MATAHDHGEPSSHSPTAYVRLHVTPLDHELLQVVLSSTLLPKARNVSYHTIETFPEKRYGFLELPSEDAEKLRKKLNGSILKGVKIRIERARPSGIPAPLGQAAMAKEKTAKKAADGISALKDKSKKRKRGTEELSGIVLGDGRKVKRGWTSADEPKEKRSKKNKEKKRKEGKKQAKSKYTDHAECLVKTMLPANAILTTDAGHSPPAKKKSKAREVVVHEFERTTKFPTFLKAVTPAGRSDASLEFVDGKGWVDENGVVVETVKPRPVPSAKVLLSSQPRRPTNVVDNASTTRSRADGEVTGKSDADGIAPDPKPDPYSAAAKSDLSTPSPTIKSEALRPKSSSSAKNLSIKIPPTTPNAPKVHPLEALYKPPAQPGGGTSNAASDTPQGFTFFSNGNNDSAEDEDGSDLADASDTQVPLTPFTRQDLELRGIRSAAPTPDTAHPNRRFPPWEPEGHEKEWNDDQLAHEDSDEEVQDILGHVAPHVEENDKRPTGNFQAWFWEHRGDLNRAWKKRRKLAGKEKRYRENKARMARAI